MSDDTINLNIKGLDKILQALSGKLPIIRVGILGSDGARGDGAGKTNAEIGAIHEFGSPGGKYPVRSFLRYPLINHLPAAIESNGGVLTKQRMQKILATGSILPLMNAIAMIAEGVVLEAFATGGYGTWKPSDMQRKKVHQTLVETTQLRDSITAEVVE